LSNVDCVPARTTSLNSSTLSPRFTLKETVSPSYFGRSWWKSWARFLTSLPSTSMMLSPDLTPTFSAGVSGAIVSTVQLGA
jgi:hypothetical protein